MVTTDHAVFLRSLACVPSGSTEEFVQKLKETSCTASHHEYVKWQAGLFRKHHGLPVKPMDVLDSPNVTNDFSSTATA
ncbi:hypothetical protein [Endozoicomonas sp. ONNA2]|uniref:hypothetical protein n=1 Tax=Endozoicomonas sp. ONNA2 TaxID=2828741 RepID=UPI0021482BBC|nr:hypothetical protein [Endozoicomonas sp. ONNA2]